jgi:serine protease Do
MKRLPFMLLCAVLLLRPAAAEVDRAAFIKLSASVLKIEALRVQGGYSIGSGVVVAPDQVVTNCHVTRDAVQIYVIRGGGRWRVQTQSRDVDHDLCLLRVPGLVAEPVGLGSGQGLALGQPLTALGYTGGAGIQSSAGEVLALHRLDGASVIQSSNWFSSGASGGGLFDDAQQLVGVLTFRLRGGAAHYYAAPIEWLAPLLLEPGLERAVAPLDAQELAFWQRPIERQPLFLRAAALARDARWSELQALALEWARTDTADPEPWHLLSQALDHLHRHLEARRALECSLAIEPGYAPARMQLARLQQSDGPLDAASMSASPCNLVPY